ncbi:hypothetical protein [Microlunatus aurantiacus]
MATADGAGFRGRSGTQRSVRILRQLILVDGTFLAGSLTHAWWSGD